MGWQEVLNEYWWLMEGWRWRQRQPRRSRGRKSIGYGDGDEPLAQRWGCLWMGRLVIVMGQDASENLEVEVETELEEQQWYPHYQEEHWHC